MGRFRHCLRGRLLRRLLSFRSGVHLQRRLFSFAGTRSLPVTRNRRFTRCFLFSCFRLCLRLGLPGLILFFLLLFLLARQINTCKSLPLEWGCRGEGVLAVLETVPLPQFRTRFKGWWASIERHLWNLPHNLFPLHPRPTQPVHLIPPHWLVPYYSWNWTYLQKRPVPAKVLPWLRQSVGPTFAAPHSDALGATVPPPSQTPQSALVVVSNSAVPFLSALPATRHSP